MASMHIEIKSNGDYRIAGMVRRLVDTVRSVSNDATTVKAVCSAYLGANPVLTDDATYSDLAVALGLTGANANANAHAFYNYLIAAEQRLNHAAITTLVDNLG